MRRWIRRNRRLLAALLFCAAAGIAVQQLTPTETVQSPVLTASRDLAAGTVLEPSSVSILQIRSGAVPVAAFESPGQVLGKQLAAPLRKGQILTDATLLGPGLLIGFPAGTVAVPLRLADPTVVQLIQPGARVNVVLSDTSGFATGIGSKTLAREVVLLWTTATANTSTDWLDSKEAIGLVVVAATAEQATALAGASTQGVVSLVLVGPGGG